MTTPKTDNQNENPNPDSHSPINRKVSVFSVIPDSIGDPGNINGLDSQSGTLKLPVKNDNKRSHAWLQEQLGTIWSEHFGDVEKLNTVTISWSRVARNRLGSITGRSGTADNPVRSEIRINALLRNPEIPQSVVWQTIAHELAHYTHGYCSPHPKSVSHPHRGGVIEKELVKRNLADVYNESEAWLKAHWHNHVHDVIGKPKRKIRRVYARPKALSLLSHLKQIALGGRRLGK